MHVIQNNLRTPQLVGLNLPASWGVKTLPSQAMIIIIIIDQLLIDHSITNLSDQLKYTYPMKQ